MINKICILAALIAVLAVPTLATSQDSGNTRPRLIMDYTHICVIEKARIPYLEAGLLTGKR